jgi:hypothetical protein
MLFCLSIALLTQSCALWGEAAKPEYEAPLTVTGTVDKAVYQPGEAVFVTVKLRNNTGEPIDLRKLDGSSVKVAYGRIDDPETPVFREPVVAAKSRQPQMTRLAPGEVRQEKFLFTRLSYYDGPMKAMVEYDPNPPGTLFNGPKLNGNVIRFEVAGEPLFERDHAGLITLEEAIELAKAKVQGTVTDAKAIIIEDESSGLYVTWVNLNVRPPQGGDATLIAYMVEPYAGSVMGEAKPFNPAAVVDPRAQRPPNMPPKPRQTGDPDPPATTVFGPGASAAPAAAPASPAAAPPAGAAR